MFNMGKFITRRRLLFALFLICVFATIPLPKKSSPDVSNEHHGRAIISLASPFPVTDELYWAVHSLTLQTITPKEIRIYMPDLRREHSRTLYTRSAPLNALTHSLVELHFVEDVGPTIKFIPVLRDQMDRYDRGDRDALDQPVIVVGIDHAHSPLLVSTLMSAHMARPSISVGLQGWWVQPDLRWGKSLNELDCHIQHDCDRLAEPYRVGVLTASEGYLVTPRMFLPPISSTTPSPISALAPILNTSWLMSSPARDSDDIWMAGSLATQGVSRYVIPLPDSPGLDVTTAQAHMAPNVTSGERTSTGALEMFKEAFIQEYQLVSTSEESKGNNCII